jgi:hypothetical protein
MRMVHKRFDCDVHSCSMQQTTCIEEGARVEYALDFALVFDIGKPAEGVV